MLSVDKINRNYQPLNMLGLFRRTQTTPYLYGAHTDRVQTRSTPICPLLSLAFPHFLSYSLLFLYPWSLDSGLWTSPALLPDFYTFPFLSLSLSFFLLSFLSFFPLVPFPPRHPFTTVNVLDLFFLLLLSIQLTSAVYSTTITTT